MRPVPGQPAVFRVLGIRSAGTARKTSRRANQADGCHHEVATIEALSSFVRHGELSSTLCTRVTNLVPGFARSQGVTFATARQVAIVIMTLATGVQSMVAGLATGTRYRPGPGVRRVLLGVLIHRLQRWELLESVGCLQNPLSRRGNYSDQQIWTYSVKVTGELSAIPGVKQTLLSPAPLVRNRLHTRNSAMFLQLRHNLRDAA